MSTGEIVIEAIGWTSTATFLLSIIHPRRTRLHELGLFTSVTTGIYGYAHGATAIWVKWVVAFFFHAYMLMKLRRATPARERLDQAAGDHADRD